MKNIFLAVSTLLSLSAVSQDKLNPAVKQGTKFTYIVHTGGQDYNFSTSLDSVSANYLKMGWNIEGLGSGALSMERYR